jgi:deoxyribodipyrimidine photolyase-related protein
MREAAIIFPHQLFREHPGLKTNRCAYIIEDSLFFGDARYPFKFHKKKLIFHRASMQAFRDFLISQNYKVKYIDYISPEEQDEEIGSFELLNIILEDDDISKVYLAEPVDWAIENRIDIISKRSTIDFIILESPAFLTSKKTIEAFFSMKKKYFQTSFYIYQRKKLGILLTDGDGKPVGGKWTFDAENRKKLPKNITLPSRPQINQNKYVKEAIQYVKQRFEKNPGLEKNFFYPITHNDAFYWFKGFLKERFAKFGPFEDAIKRGESLLFHSLLSPLLNTGLLTPKQVVEDTLKYAKGNRVPLNSLEGFIRQIIGWREFMRAIYELEGVKERNSNHWEHTNSMPHAFYNATTGILPIDEIIKRVLETGYLHHIERLMLLGNFMVLCEINPNEIYKWFMELFIDAYDWVMVPNVYGMSTYADGGLITTKPYVSSSNYILKMSDYPKGDWCAIWDGLFWRFISHHREAFKSNPRMSLMVKILDKKDKGKLNELLEIAKNFLKKLHKN